MLRNTFLERSKEVSNVYTILFEAPPALYLEGTFKTPHRGALFFGGESNFFLDDLYDLRWPSIVTKCQFYTKVSTVH